jgi:hypothetical protein
MSTGWRSYFVLAPKSLEARKPAHSENSRPLVWSATEHRPLDPREELEMAKARFELDGTVGEIVLADPPLNLFSMELALRGRS